MTNLQMRDNALLLSLWGILNDGGIQTPESPLAVLHCFYSPTIGRFTHRIRTFLTAFSSRHPSDAKIFVASLTRHDILLPPV